MVLEFSMIHGDSRRAALERWLAPRVRRVSFQLTPASEDASFRRYWRATLADGRTYVAMDAPPDKEDCRPFVRVARMLAAAGVHAPEVIAQELDQGFLLLSDLGSRTYLEALNDANAAALFADATEALLRWQLATRAGELPPYDEALLRREMNLFPEWYVGRHLKKELSAAQKERLESVFVLLVKSALAQPTVYVHRDYMPRNLMVCEPNPGRARFPGRGVRADHLRRGVARARRLRELGRRARARLGRALLGESQKPGPAGGCRLRRVLARARMDGAAAPSSRCSGYSPASTTATASPSTFRTPRASSAMRVRFRRRYRELAPLARLLDELE